MVQGSCWLSSEGRSDRVGQIHINAELFTNCEGSDHWTTQLTGNQRQGTEFSQP